MSCGGASGSENSSNYAVHRSEKSVYLSVKLITLSGVELATVQVDKDATIGQFVAKMKKETSLPEVDCCSIVFPDDRDIFFEKIL